MQNDDEQLRLDKFQDELSAALREISGQDTSPNRLKAISATLSVIAKNLHEAVNNDTDVTIQERPEETLAARLHQYIIANLEEPLPSAKILATLFHTNQRKIKEDFHRQYGTSIYNYFLNARLEKAKSLIAGTNKIMKEIAIDCGFNTYHSFYCAFSRTFGFAPTSLKDSDRQLHK